jgi:predicted NAD/FAD-binding protein
MLVEVKRFHRDAQQALTRGDDALTLRRFLAAGRYSAYFVQHFIVPLVSCVWSTSQAAALDYPARYLFSFLDNHGMLSVTRSPQWRTVTGGSRSYVEKAVKGLTSVRLATPVRSVRRHADGFTVRDGDGDRAHYSRVVLATHADTALALLAAPSVAERDVLGEFGYSRNRTVLHTDSRILSSTPRAQASWNYLMPNCATASADVVVSYDLNRLQRLDTSTRLVVSLNAGDRIDPGQVVDEMDYDHPIHTVESVAAQRRLPALNDGRLAFAGAYHGWGFHEDGCRSGVEAARSLGVEW